MKKTSKNINTTIQKKPVKVPAKNATSYSFNNKWLYFILAIITFVVYANCITNGYAYNDELNILSNPNLKNITSVFSFGLKVGFFETTNFPFTKFIFFLEYTIFGFRPIISHLINLLFYIGAILCVFKLLKNHFFADNSWLAFFITILFAVHPIHTEVVNNIQNRGEVIAFLFTILSMDLFLTFTKSNHSKYLILALFTFICALLCSPFSIIGIIVLVFYMILFQQEKIRSVAFLTIVILSFLSVIYFILTYKKMADTIFFVQNPIVEYTTFIDKFSMICMSAIMYFKLLLFPVKLSFYYGYNTIEINKIIVFSSIILHALLCFLFVYFLKRNKLISFFIGFHFISLLFYINIFFAYPGIIAEKTMLFSSLPFCVLIVLAMNAFVGDKAIPIINRPIFWYSFLAICSLFAVRSIARNMDWKDTLTLMSNDIQHLEKSANANYLFAEENILAYNADGNKERKTAAEISLKKSIEILPDYSLALSKLGYLYSVINNDTLVGLDYMQRAYKVSPDDATITSNLALGYNKVANPDSALSLFKKAIEIDSNNRWSYFYAAQLLFDNGKQTEAFEKNEVLRTKFPENELAYLNYGTFYFRLNKEDSSIMNFELAVKYGSKNKGLINHLFSVFSKKGDEQKVAYYQSLLDEN
jgi:tetratricopeptide (TPR) repeat protein